ncbi:MAG: hypothetical protein ACQES2_11635 [Pseudomonadota bacterium]
MKTVVIRVLALASLLASSPVLAEWQMGVETGVFRPEYNKVQIPNDSQGDRFRITDLGDGSFEAFRLSLSWQPSGNHELQWVYAPFVYRETGRFDSDVRFEGAVFAQGDTVEARYQFSNYRMRYLYRWRERDRWTVDIGGTLFVRDAAVQLSASGEERENSNVGLVPLFAVRGTYSPNKRWSAVVDTDVAIAPQGRAIDLSITGQYSMSEHWVLAGGYRTIEGGADNEDVYSFAWFNGATLSVMYHWQ